MKAACFWRSFQGPAYKGLATLFAQPFVMTQEGQSALLKATPADSALRDHGPRSTQRDLASVPASPPTPIFSKSQQTHPSHLFICLTACPLPCHVSCGLASTEPLG